MDEQSNFSNNIPDTFKESKYRFTICEYMWRDLQLNNNEALVFAIIKSFKYYNCNISEPNESVSTSSLNYLTGLSRSCLRKILQNLVEDGIISVTRYRVSQTVVKNIYVANYNENGRIPDFAIKEALKAGRDNAEEYYTSIGRYTRGARARRKKIVKRIEEAFNDNLLP